MVQVNFIRLNLKGTSKNISPVENGNEISRVIGSKVLNKAVSRGTIQDIRSDQNNPGYFNILIRCLRKSLSEAAKPNLGAGADIVLNIYL
ncbi:hypothetical protein C8255_13700 [filamentous cyanobacterium CCP3]|nr:hypothetical protein C8255_13700 [filamentous cyanobacterium CCP3]